MNRKLLSLLVALVAMFWCLGSVKAQDWKFVNETFYQTDFYFYNPTHKVFLKAISTVASNPNDATCFTVCDEKNTLGVIGYHIRYNDNGYKYVYEGSGNANWGTTNDRPWGFDSKNGGYYIWHYDPNRALRQRFINYNGSSVDYPYEKFNDNNRTWYMISPAQMTDELSRQAKIQGYNLTPYTGEHGKWNDVSGYIKNANVYQSYSDNTKIPFGWTAYKHESGNGTYSLGTGDTKLECWNGTANKFDVDYYQIVKLPKGKYRLSADVLFRGTENAVALYASQQGTSNEIQTLVNVSGDELNTYYVEFEVTSDNTEFSIGVKKVGTNTVADAWMAADNFKLEYWTEDAPVVQLNSDETAWVMTGTWLASDMEMLNTTISANPKLLLDASDATLVGKPTIPVPAAVPNMMIKVANADDVANTQNVIAKGECANFVLTDKKDFAPLEDFVAKNISYTRTNTAGYNTVCMPFALKASDLAGTCTAYSFVNKEEGIINFEENGADALISAGTPILVEDTGSEWTVKISGNRNVVANAGSKGIVEGAFIKRTLGEGFYKLNSAGTEFVHSTSSSTITPFRFFANGGSSSEVKSFVVKFVKANEETAIKGLQQETATDGVVYDLMGRKVAGAVRPGIYIKGGKKVMIK